MKTVEPTSHQNSKEADIARLKALEARISARRADTLEKIKRIPHLPIDLELDVERALAEVQQLEEWRPHQLHPNKRFRASYLRHHEMSFRGVCLVDFQKDWRRGMIDPPSSPYREPDAQIDEEGRVRYFVTDAGEKTPYIVSKLREISPYVNRARVIRTPPGGGIPWHSHHNNVYKQSYLRLAIFNWPLATHPGCVHRVRDYRDPNGEIFERHYEVGRCHLFNSWHDHEFWNNSDQERITIIPYFNFTDEALLDFLETQMARYDGPWLPD